MGVPSRNDPATSVLHVGADQVDHPALDGVDLRQDDQAGGHLQQTADVEVLAGLRHDRLVGGDHQHHGVEAADAGQHVLHEALVAGHVDERHAEARGLPMREAEVDGDAAVLFFLQPVGIGAGQRQHEAALAVIDVPGGADHDVLHGRQRLRRVLPRRGWRGV